MNAKKPNGVIYFIVYIIFYPLLKALFRLKVRREGPLPDKPFLVLSNHSSFMDFLLVMLAFYPLRLNAVAARKFFLYRPLDKLLPFMGCIPKNLFDPDARSIISIRNSLKRGGSVLLFPEGRCSTDGEYAGIHASTGKLIKSLGVPVVGCRIEGSYLCMPFWRKGIRRGRVVVSISGLFTAEEAGTASVDEINAAIDERLSGADAKPYGKTFRTSRARRLAEGLEQIIYLCPQCKSEFRLSTKGNEVRCYACGMRAVMGRDGTMAAAGGGRLGAGMTVPAWYKEQIRHEMSGLREDMRPIILRVAVKSPAKEAGGGMRASGRGILRLSPKGWEYRGELDGRIEELLFPIDTVPALPFDPNDDFQIYSGGSFYMFTPQDPLWCAKYSVVGECAYHRFASRVMMTVKLRHEEGGPVGAAPTKPPV